LSKSNVNIASKDHFNIVIPVSLTSKSAPPY
jgi:hypothetical protein